MPYLAFLFICTVWGASFILMERASHALGPVEIGLLRLLGGALVLGVYWRIFSRQRVQIKLRDWGHILVVALLANAWPFVIQPYTMSQAGEHAYFGMLVALVPLATILVSIPMLGILPSRRQLVGVLGGMGCMTLAVYDGSARGISTSLLVLALTVPVSYAVGNAYVKWKLDHIAALPLTTLFLGLGGILLLPLQASPERVASGRARPALRLASSDRLDRFFECHRHRRGDLAVCTAHQKPGPSVRWDGHVCRASPSNLVGAI